MSAYFETVIEGRQTRPAVIKEDHIFHSGICRLLTLFLIAFGIALPATAAARDHDVAKVIGRVQFEGKALVDMVLTTGAGRRYLYVQHSDKEVSILDVTDPSRPVVLKNTLWLEGAKVGEVTFFGDYTIGQVLPTHCSRPVPHERRAQGSCGFNDVKRAIFDKGLLYVLSDTGLSIINGFRRTAIPAESNR